MKALAIDLGGGHATCALVEDDAFIEAEAVSLPRGTSLRDALPAIERALREALRRAETPASACEGIAFGFCGLVDSARGRVLSTNEKYADGPTIDLAQWSRATFDLPVRLENDARLALLGEAYAGAARGFRDVVMMTLGTGIGGATMIEGRLLRGRHFQAGCLGGHLPVAFDGRRCTCGAIGCAEAEASSIALADVCHATPAFQTSALAREPELTQEALFRHAATGDAIAVAIRDRFLRVWGAAAVAMIHAYDPEVVVLGGGVMRSGEIILPALRAYVEDHAWTPWGKLEVRAAALGNHAALLGAIPLLEER